MIHRKFNNLKFTRTYIGGSKREELRLFTEVQGIKDDNSECNWLEYRRYFMEYCDDKLNILLSWSRLTGLLRPIFIAIGVLVSINSLGIGSIILGFALISHILYVHLKSLEQKRLSEYNFSLDVINSQTGLQLSKN